MDIGYEKKYIYNTNNVCNGSNEFSNFFFFPYLQFINEWM